LNEWLLYDNINVSFFIISEIEGIVKDNILFFGNVVVKIEVKNGNREDGWSNQRTCKY
jgi:hypothetical protein